MKKIILLLSVLMLTQVAMFAQSWNVGTPNASFVTATLSGNTLTIRGIGAMQNFTTAMLPPWYNNKNSIDTLVIEKGVTTIGDYAFFWCEGITGSLNLSEDITIIGNSAFANCTGLNSFAIPESVIKIGEQAFSGCSGLYTLTISKNVTTIGEGAFGTLSYNLSEINVDPSNPNYNSEDGILYDKNKTKVIQCPQGKNGSITLPESVTKIENSAFYGCNGISSISFPEGMTTIGEAAFLCCFGVNSFTIPSSVSTIEGMAFYWCDGISSIINLAPIPQTIESSVFSRLTLSNITLYVPAVSVILYKNAPVWKDFNIIALPEVSENDILITPSENSVLIEWRAYQDIEGCRMCICRDVERTYIDFILEFNAAGELISVSQKAKNATQVKSLDFSYLLENLQSETTYYYTIETLGVNRVVLASQLGMFTTTEEYRAGIIETNSTYKPSILGYYNFLGKKLPKEPACGMYVIVYSKGKAQKVIK